MQATAGTAHALHAPSVEGAACRVVATLVYILLLAWYRFAFEYDTTYDETHEETTNEISDKTTSEAAKPKRPKRSPNRKRPKRS